MTGPDGPDAVEAAVRAAVAAAPGLARRPAAERADALRRVAASLTDDAEAHARDITAATGKPLRWSRTEVARAAAILGLAAEEATRFHPEAQRLDGQDSGAGRLALTRRVVRGPVLAITPFNFPLHLVAHKVAPALAVGAPVLVKPTPRAPRPAHLLARLAREAGLGEGALGVVDADDERTAALVADPRLPVVTFTGSDAVGWRIVDAAPRKQVVVELGGNAAAVIAPDHTGEADLHHAARRVALFAHYCGGQACTSPQRVYVPRGHVERFVELLVAESEAQVSGDPWDPATDVGPLVDDEAAARVTAWIGEAVDGGAAVRTGGTRTGRHVAPTVLTDVPAGARVLTDEVFGPVVSVLGYDTVDEALAAVDDSRFGLSVGLFTRDLTLAFRALDELEVGQVVVGDAPTYRSDVSPFGGVKDSGRGREGLRSAMEDYTVERTLVLSGVAL